MLAIFTLVGFFLLPPVVKSQLEKRASEALGRTVTVGKVRLNPYALSITLEGFDVRDADGLSPFLGWRRLHVDFDALASLRGYWTLGTVEVDGFRAAPVLLADGSFNFSDILDRLVARRDPAAPEKPGRPFNLGRLDVTDARVEFVDQSQSEPFVTVLGPLAFSVTGLRTATGDPGAPYQFHAVTEAGERLAWSGTLAAVPFKSTGELKLENIVLPKYAAYYVDRLGGDILEGKLTVRGRYVVDLSGKERVVKLADGAVQLRDFKLQERANQELAVDLPSLDVTGIEADALALESRIASVLLQGGRLRLRRERDGTLNLPALFKSSGAAPPPVAAPAPPAVASEPLPDVVIAEVAARDLGIELTDLAAPRAAQLGLEGIQFSVRDVSLADGARMPVQLALNWTPGGSVKIDGTVTIRPEISAELKTDVSALEILPLSPYLEQAVNARFTQGAVTSAGAVQVAMKGDDPAIRFEGGATIEKLGLVDGAQNEELAGVAMLTLNGIKVTTAPQLAISLDEVALAAPYARARVNQDGALNFAAITKTGPAPEESGTIQETPSPAPPPQIAIHRVSISEGDFSLEDRSVEPNVRMAVRQLGGTLTDLSSENPARGSVDLKAAVDGSGPVAITGRIDPLGERRFVDVKVDCRNVDLLPLSPYSVKYAGYELARGQLALDVKARLDDAKLDAANVITLNQLTFGAPVPSPTATSLPVRLGVALLKDRDGRIVVDVPMAGSLDDPDFSVGRVVSRVIVNLLTKAATSPFALLGSMFGGGGEELAFQEFAPGTSELRPSETGKLATMIKALENRPGLNLAIEGGYDRPADVHVIKQRKFEALVRSRIWGERRAGEPNVAPPDRLEAAPHERAAAVKMLFDEKFPPGTEFGAPLPLPPSIANAPAPKRNMLRRVVDVVTFRRKRDAPAEPAPPPEPVPQAVVAGPSLEEMTGRLVEAMEVTDNDLRVLAAERAQRVRDYFLKEGGIAADRLFLAQAGAAKENKGPRVFLSLQ